jgi:MoaA/NifB/PqqE/SkfB family radical SAM enzyme
MGDLSFVWLELTGRCQLRCTHCYAESGPSGTHGSMSAADWLRVIDQAAGLGVKSVQFIGGEPTVYPDLAVLVLHALARVMHVEVFSNLVHVRPDLWMLFSVPGVSLATSYYSDDPGQHEAITGRRGSHAKTRANIAEAIKRGSRCGWESSNWGISSAGGRLLPSWRRSVSPLSAVTGSVKSGEVSGTRDQI